MRYPYSKVRECIIQKSTKWTYFNICSERCYPLWFKINVKAQFIVSLIVHNIFFI